MDKQRIYYANKRNKDVNYKKMMADIRVKELDAMRISGLYEHENLTNQRRYELILKAEGIF